MYHKNQTEKNGRNKILDGVRKVPLNYYTLFNCIFIVFENT